MDLIIDGNAFINVAISVTKSITAKDKRVGEKYYVSDLFNGGHMLKAEARQTFRGFCFTYLSSLIAPIGQSLDRVHLVFDSKSWRKQYISSFFESADFKTDSAPTEFAYKGNRKYDEYQYLFFDYFQQVLLPTVADRCGINIYRFKETEGDDIIAYLCEILDRDVLIYSVDQDLKQLVTSKEKNVLLIIPKQMSKTKRLFTPMELKPELAMEEEDDFFSLDDSHISGSSTDRIIATLKGKDYSEFRVEPTTEVLTKILLGDKSDHIPKLGGLTPVKAKKIIDSIQTRFGDRVFDLLDKLDPEFLEHLLEQVCSLNKIKAEDTRDELLTHLKFNIKIIRLSSKVFPEEIRGALDQFFEHYQMSSFKPKEFITLKSHQEQL